MTPTIQSYEAHITIEPVFGQRFDEFESLCRSYGFRPAELLLMKSRQETPVRSNKDSFCTGHGREYTNTLRRTEALVSELKANGFQVWRYKVEGMLVDVRTPPLVKITVADGASHAI